MAAASPVHASGGPCTQRAARWCGLRGRPAASAEFVAVAGDLSSYRDVGRPAAHAGLAPVPRDSGRRTGNLHRPERYDRRLRWVFYLSAQSAMMYPGSSRDFHLRKRAEGLRHVQAVLALARRRVDVRWAMLRDHRPYVPAPASN